MIDMLQTLILGLLLGGTYALFASGLTLVFGVMRIVNLAHPVFIFTAAFITYSLNQWIGIDPLLAIFITLPLMFVVGVVIYRVFLAHGAESPRYPQMTVLLTFAIALMIEGTLSFIYTSTNRTVNPAYATEAFFLGDIFIPKSQLYAGLISLVLFAGLWALLRYTRLGYGIRATMQNRTAAKTVGVDVERVSTIAFGIGIALAGASGSVFTLTSSFFPNGHWEYVGLLLSLIVLGGMGSLFGSIVGALLLAVIAAFVSQQYGPTWSPLTFYLCLFIVLLVRPQGLFGKKLEAA